MSFRSQWQEIRTAALMGGGLAVFLGLCLLVFGIGDGLARLSYSLPFPLRSERPPGEVVIVYMDEESHQRLEQPFFTPWDRTLHARLVDRLRQLSVRAVAFDIGFDSRTTNDAIFLRAMKAHGKVVLGARYTPIGIGRISFWNPLLPIAEFTEAAAWGVAEVADEDEMVRQHYRIGTHSTNIVSLAWRTAEVAGARPLPDPFRPRWINYYGPPGVIPWVSYAAVISNTVPAHVLSNKVVFVGARVGTGFSGGKGTDDFLTPYSYWMATRSPGVEITATTCLNILRRDWLVRLSPLTEVAVVMAAGLLAGLGLSFCRPILAMTIGVIAVAACFGAACLLMWKGQVWFPWAIVGFVQVPCAAICSSVFGAQRVFREKATLEEQLAHIGSTSAEPTPNNIPPRYASFTPTPSLMFQQQVREKFGTPIPNASPDAVTAIGAQGAPPIPDCTPLRRIGQGAYGEVWIGRTVLGAYRAVKIVYRKNFEEDRPYDREFEGIKHFDPVSRNHPGLVHVLHVGRNDADGYFYYLMELADDVHGTSPINPERYEPLTLGREMQRLGRIPLEDCIQLALSLTDSLAHLHASGLIHRDIKPSNIIIVDGKPKLADIGLVTSIGDGRTFVGTEGFFPPEGPGSPSADVYSLGKLLYEALTGLSRHKFPDLPTGIYGQGDPKRFKIFNRIILRACEVNTRQRYSSAQQMQQSLRQLAAKDSHLPSFSRLWSAWRRRSQPSIPPHR